MAGIKIYGTLINDTGEPIAYLDQIYNRSGSKNVETIIDDKIKAIDIPEYVLPAATNTTLGGVKIGNHLMVHDGLISVYDARDDQKGVISETKVKGLAQGKLLDALSEFTGQSEAAPEEGEDSAHPFFPEYAKLVAFGSWAMTDDAFEIFKSKMDEPPLEEYANIKDGTITIGKVSIKPLTTHQSLANYQTKTEAANTYATKTDLQNLATRVETLENVECMTEQDARDMVARIFK